MGQRYGPEVSFLRSPDLAQDDTPVLPVEISAAIHSHGRNGRYQSEKLYGEGNAAKRIADIIASAPLRIEKRFSF